MGSGGVLNVASFILLECALIVAASNAGKKASFNIQVPKVINHKHHTNLVFLHKDHDNDNFGNYHEGGFPVKSSHKTHSYGKHHSYSHGQPLTYSDSYSHEHPLAYSHSHSFGHGHHYSFSNGQDGDQGKLVQKQKPKYSHNLNHGFTPSTYNLKPSYHATKAKTYKHPKAKTHHYSYQTFSPSFELGSDNTAKELNQAIKDNFHPDAKTFGDFPGLKTGVDHNEPLRDFGFHESKPNYEKQFDKVLVSKNLGIKGAGDFYHEDYTNPNSVSKYTSAIKHGGIDLQNTIYNREHGNSIDKYINAYNNPFAGI